MVRTKLEGLCEQSWNDALEKLTLEDAELAKLVKLRFFAGLAHQEIADALGISVPTVERPWAFARAWLFEAIRHGA